MAGSTCCDESLFSVITLTVIAFNDAPADGTLQVRFDELGGSIGRAASNQLVLPDPERMVSRVAAQVVYRNGGFAIIDRGSNPISLNGRALASGREAPLAAGDRLRICGYELRVDPGGATVAAAGDPFSDLLGPAPARGARADPSFDPLAKPALVARPAPAPAGGIPLDWDPFAPVAAPAAAAPLLQRDSFGLDTGAAAPAALVPELPGSASAGSLDQLFGLGPSSGGDPLAQSMLDAPLAQPNMAADADPMRSLNSAPKASAAAEADQLSDLQRPFIPPTTIKPPAPVAAAPAAVMSWEAGGAPVAAPAPSARPAAPPPAAAAAAAPAARSAPEDGAALLEALRRGLDAPSLDLPALTPALMELIGQLLREAVGGTVELLRARTTVKHELRAEVTTIVPKHNNPLKFSPSVEVALQHLLAPPARGFIAAAPAMRDAYDDLRAHHLAIVAGMQAVLEAALQRFDPSALEGRLGDRTLLHSLLPSARSARLWDMFGEHYARIRSDARDDFHAVFGKAFLAAYDEQVERLHAQREAG
jgi:FHA domain-containing protein